MTLLRCEVRHCKAVTDSAQQGLIPGDGWRIEWDLSFVERAAILDGARVVLTFLNNMPPCRIEVEGTLESWQESRANS